MPTNLENTAVATGLEKVSFHSNTKERQCQRMFKLLHNCTHLPCQQSNAQNSPSEVSQYVNCELPDVQAGFRKGRGSRDKIAKIRWIIKTAREFQKNIYFCLPYLFILFCFIYLFMQKPLTMWITTNCGKFLKRWDYQATLPAS